MASNDIATLSFKTEFGSDIDQTTYYLGLLVPAGRRCFIANRRLKLSEGDFDVDVVTAENGFSGGSVGTISPLYDGVDPNVGSRIHGGVTPSGAISVIQPDFVYTGGVPGVSTPPSTPDEDIPLRSWVQSPLIRIVRRNATGAYRLSINVLAYEEVEE